jgi:hypothetical protein
VHTSPSSSFSFLHKGGTRMLLIYALLALATGSALGIMHLNSAHAAGYAGQGITFNIYLPDNTTIVQLQVTANHNSQTATDCIGSPSGGLDPSPLTPLAWNYGMSVVNTEQTHPASFIGLVAKPGTTVYLSVYPPSVTDCTGNTALTYHADIPASPTTDICWLNMVAYRISGC